MIRKSNEMEGEAHHVDARARSHTQAEGRSRVTSSLLDHTHTHTHKSHVQGLASPIEAGGIEWKPSVSPTGCAGTWRTGNRQISRRTKMAAGTESPGPRLKPLVTVDTRRADAAAPFRGTLLSRN